VLRSQQAAAAKPLVMVNVMTALRRNRRDVSMLRRLFYMKAATDAKRTSSPSSIVKREADRLLNSEITRLHRPTTNPTMTLVFMVSSFCVGD
jgi:hypothetical protein